MLKRRLAAPIAAECVYSNIIPTRVPEDYNGDGVVNAADYAVWRDSTGQIGTNLAADGTGPGGAPDGVVDDLDYQFWTAQFGQFQGSAAPQSIDYSVMASDEEELLAGEPLKRRSLESANSVIGGIMSRANSLLASFAAWEARFSVFRLGTSALQFKLLILSVSLLLCQSVSYPARAANLTVNSNQVVNNTIAGVSTPATLGNIAIGMNTSVYYNHIDASYMSPALDNTGVSIVRYPGGNFSDIYHWTDNVATGNYAATTSNFGTFAKSILNSPSGLAKQAMVTVDYGESLNAKMGGQPQEAAAWVAYANGTINGANATMQLGTDGEGNNWGSVRYWAGLRAANPNDANWATDGSVGVVLTGTDMPTGPSVNGNPPPALAVGSFLRIQRAAPIGVQYWEIGNELNGNGYFGSNLNWQNDKHSLAVGAARQGDPNLSPTFYGQQVVAFSAQMKAVDPTIKIGAVLNNASNYDPLVLQATAQNPITLQNQFAAQAIDFGIVHYYPNYGGSSDPAALSFLTARVNDVPNTINGERTNYLKQYKNPDGSLIVDASHIPIFITEFGNLGNTLPTVDEGLQTVIDNAGFLQSGVTSSEMWEMVTKSFLNDTATLSPSSRGSYYGMEALHDFIRPGDSFVASASSQNSTGIVYAAKRPDGTIALMLINPNTASQAMPVTINGAALKDGGIQYLTSLAADPVQSTVTGLGNYFTPTVAGRSIAVYLLTPRLPGDFNDDGVVDSADYIIWRSSVGQMGQDLAADFTGPNGTPDGVVDNLDYQFWVDHYGLTSAGSGASAAAAVPEPSSFALAVVGMLLVGARKTRARIGSRRRGLAPVC